jgi:hypothetical protein
MQRSQPLQLVRSLRATIRPTSRRYASVPAPEPGFATGEEFLAKREAIKHHAARRHRVILSRSVSADHCAQKQPLCGEI